MEHCGGWFGNPLCRGNDFRDDRKSDAVPGGDTYTYAGADINTHADPDEGTYEGADRRAYESTYNSTYASAHQGTDASTYNSADESADERAHEHPDRRTYTGTDGNSRGGVHGKPDADPDGNACGKPDADAGRGDIPGADRGSDGNSRAGAGEKRGGRFDDFLENDRACSLACGSGSLGRNCDIFPVEKTRKISNKLFCFERRRKNEEIVCDQRCDRNDRK